MPGSSWTLLLGIPSHRKNKFVTACEPRKSLAEDAAGER